MYRCKVISHSISSPLWLRWLDYYVRFPKRVQAPKYKTKMDFRLQLMTYVLHMTCVAGRAQMFVFICDENKQCNWKIWIMWIMHRIIQLLSWLLIRNGWSSALLPSQSVILNSKCLFPCLYCSSCRVSVVEVTLGTTVLPPLNEDSSISLPRSLTFSPLHGWIKFSLLMAPPKYGATHHTSTPLPTLGLGSYFASVFVLVFM